MSSVQSHYAQLLGPVYTWMAGGWDAALARNRVLLDSLGLAAWPRGVAVDLGCGSGFQSIPLAEAGFDVVALDLNEMLLAELRGYAAGLPVQVVQDDLLNFKRKVEAGAHSAITQYFYNADCYFHFVDECEAMGLNLPIVPGIMPIGKFSQLARFSDACGAEIPRWMRRKFEGYGDDSDSIRAFGLDVVTRLCEDLLAAGAPGLHFYTMNQAGLTTTIWQRLGL